MKITEIHKCNVKEPPLFLSTILFKYIFISAILMGFAVTSFAGMKDYISAEFEDLLLYEGNGPEIILTHEQSAGTGHYEKEMRIFVDNGDNLEAVFSYPLIEEHYFSGIYPEKHIAFVGEVEFAAPDEEEGYRDITVKTTKYIFSNDPNTLLPEGNKKGVFVWGGEVLNKEDLGIMRFHWDEEQYVLVDDEMPQKLAEKYAYEEKVYEAIGEKGKKVGDMIFW